MSAQSAVLAGRAASEALMVDSVIIDRPGDAVLNETTGQMVPTFTPVYAGKCRVQNWRPGGQTPAAGEHQFTILTLYVQLPVDATVYRIKDRLRITASTLDPALVGRELIVSDLMHKTHATARRLVCEEVIA